MKEIPLFKVFMSKEAVEVSIKTLTSGYIGQGPMVEQFEKDLKDWLGFIKHYRFGPITTNSATSAEHLAFHIVKRQIERDEVLTTPLTCTATNWPILANGLKIKWVDIDERTLNMDLDDLRRKITDKTRIIMLVHWGGYPVDLEKIEQIKRETLDLFRFKPIVIEDCAHAFGSVYNNLKIGTHAENFCTFSFQAIKALTTVDGGMLIVPRDEYTYERAKLLRWYGIDRDAGGTCRCERNIDEWGFKFHMNDVAAGIGIENLKHADRLIGKHQENAAYYNEKLQNIAGLTLLENAENKDSSYWLYSILVEDRSDFIEHMANCNIMTSQVHARNDKHSCVKWFKSHLPTLDKIAPKIVCIPVGWWVTEEDREYIVDCIKQGW